MSAAYVDSSAMVKLVVEEAESPALADALAGFERRISSELLVTEVGRAGLRAVGERGLRRAEAVCASIDLAPLSRSILDRAAAIPPPALRALDAIHLATALETSPSPVLVAYDLRLLEAARAHGLDTASPGRDD